MKEGEGNRLEQRW